MSGTKLAMGIIRKKKRSIKQANKHPQETLCPHK